RDQCDFENINAHQLESLVYNKIRKKIEELDIDEFMGKYSTHDPNKKVGAAISKINNQITKLEDSAMTLLENKDLYDPDTFRKMNLKLKSEIAELRNKKNDLENELKISDNVISKEDIQKELEEFIKMDLSDIKNSRRIFHKWIKRIKLDGDKVLIDQKFKI